MATVFNSFPFSGKKSNEIDEFTDELVGDEIIFISNPTTGKLYRSTYAEIKAYFNKNVSSSIELAAGIASSSYQATEDIDIKVLKFHGSTAADIGVGLSNGVNDIYEPGHLAANSRLFIDGIIHVASGTTIYFNGVQSDTITTIFKL